MAVGLGGASPRTLANVFAEVAPVAAGAAASAKSRRGSAAFTAVALISVLTATGACAAEPARADIDAYIADTNAMMQADALHDTGRYNQLFLARNNIHFDIAERAYPQLSAEAKVCFRHGIFHQTDQYHPGWLEYPEPYGYCVDLTNQWHVVARDAGLALMKAVASQGFVDPYPDQGTVGEGYSTPVPDTHHLAGATSFSVGDTGGIEVTAFLGDREGPVRMCVDTGAFATTVDQDTAPHLLNTQQARLSDDAHMVIGDGTEHVVQTIIIAEMGKQDGAGMVGWATENVRALVVPRSLSSGTVGCLGLNYITRFSRFRFNWRNHTIDAKPGPRARLRVPDAGAALRALRPVRQFPPAS
jgi:hypothetical protein